MNERPAEPDAEQVWQEHADRLLRQLRTKLAGLNGDEVRSRLEAYGPNDAANVKRTPLWLQLLARFGNPLIILLLIAGAVSAATGDIASFGITVCSLMLGQNAVEALHQPAAVQAKCGATAKLFQFRSASRIRPP
jgi:Mg2+-importing ATPase